MRKEVLAQLAARIGLSSVFLYAGVSGFLNPSDWIGYIPSWATTIVPVSSELLLAMHSAFEIVLGVLLLFGFRLQFLAITATADLIVILLTTGINAVTFRDLGLIGLSLSLALTKPTGRQRKY